MVTQADISSQEEAEALLRQFLAKLASDGDPEWGTIQLVSFRGRTEPGWEFFVRSKTKQRVFRVATGGVTTL